MQYTIRNIKIEEFKKIYKRIEQDFAPGEYAPYNILYKQLLEGHQKGFLLLEGNHEVAYSICAVGKNDYVLLSLLAVFKEVRGQGFGSAFLDEIKKTFSDMKGIVVEVEKIEEEETNEEKAIREKRIHFYQKAGFCLVPNIDYSIWDVPMHLMVLPLKVSSQVINEEIGNIIYEIYLELMGETYIHKLKFARFK